MKKYLAFIFLLLVSLSLAPFSFVVKAEEELHVETYYPTDIQDYLDLTNIKLIAVSEDNIAYSLDGLNLNIYNKTTREIHTISYFTNIKFIKYIDHNLLVVDNSKILIINNLNITDARNLKVFVNNLPEYKGLDIYSTSEKIYIGYVTNNNFELLIYNEIAENATPSDIKTPHSSPYYQNTFMLTINNSRAYIVYANGDYGKTGIGIFDYKTTNLTINEKFVSYAKFIDIVKYNNEEFLMTFTDQSLILLNTDIEVLCELTINDKLDPVKNPNPITSLSWLDSYNNSIYVSDAGNKAIQTIVIEYDSTITQYSIKSDNVLLCSDNAAKGRFNHANNIFIQGNKLLVSDTKNNRIQILDNHIPTAITLPKDYINAKNIVRDSVNNFYLVATNNDVDKIIRYTPRYVEKIIEEYPNSNAYNYFDSFTPEKENCKISSLTVANDFVYGIDYINNEIFYQGNNSTISKCRFRSSDNYNVNLTENSQIVYLKKLDNFVIINKVDNNTSKLYLLNGNCETIHEIEISQNNGVTPIISCGISEIYLLNNNKLQAYSIENNQIVFKKEIINNSFSTISNISFDSENRKMFAFDSYRQCIVSFDCTLIDNPFSFSDFTEAKSVNNDCIPYIHSLGNHLIYSFPYELGETYNNNFDIEYVIAIDSFDNYSRVLFNNHGTLNVGYIHKDKIKNNKLEYTFNKINVITVQQKVSVYKYPTSLRYNDNHIVTETFPIDTKLTLTHITTNSIDDKTFYVYKHEDNIGFICSTDIILDNNNHITALHTENASIQLFSEDSIAILDEDKSTTIYILKDKDRIYVENYDKHSTYTKVIYKDDNQKTYEGYVLTENIKMDKLDTSKIILISLIVISVIIVIVIIISYINIKKKK